MSKEIVLKKMDDQIVFWQKTGDNRQYFLSCYRLMTGNMLQAIIKGDFHDTDWVERLLVRFSDYYFEALDHFEKSEPTPPVWRTVHENCCARKMHTLQYMLMGINAHINFDLVLTIYDLLQEEWSNLSDNQKRKRYEDHTKVNDIIYSSIDAVQDTIIEKEHPSLDIIDKLFGRADEYLLSRLINHWRDEVWEKAVELLDEKSEAIRLERIGNLSKEVDKFSRNIAMDLF